MIELTVNLPVGYVFEESTGSGRGVLVLHGFSDHGKSVRKRCLGGAPLTGFNVLSPNGLFPCPIKNGDQYKEAYSWYFRDPKTGVQMIPPELAADACLKLIEKLELSHLEWVILGFSQGGFLAPFLVRAGLKTLVIIGVGAGYRRESYSGIYGVDVFAIHGEADTIVPYDHAKAGFEEIQKLGFGGRFYSLPGVGHGFDDSGREIVRQILKNQGPA